MSGPIIIAIAVILVVAALLFTRRDRARQIAFGSEPPAAARRSAPRRARSRTSGSRAVESAPAAPPASEIGHAMPTERQPRAGTPWGPTAAALSPDDLTDLLHALSSGRKIAAIKLVRDRTGMSLKDAKDLVDSLPDDGRS